MCEVSIIMGIYKMIKKENLVKLAIDSILNQTYKDFEFIICDDGSNDGTYEMVKNLTKNDSRVILIKNNENKGLAYSLNHCLSIAKGKYIARMDADDISMPDRLVEYLDRNTNIAVLGTWAKIIDKEGQVISSASLKTGYNNIIACAMCDSPLFHPSVMIRKEFLQLN